VHYFLRALNMTDRYAVIGNPISHSKSPQIHRMFAKQTEQDIRYEKIEAPLDSFAATIHRLRDEGYKGCSVTVPFKFEAFKLATELSTFAQIAEAVNTLKLNFRGDEIRGENTDGHGLVKDIRFNLGIALNKKRVLLIGAGGAASGVALPIMHQGAVLTIINRNAEKAKALATHAGNCIDKLPIEKDVQSYAPSGYSLDDISNQTFDVIINATSAGLTDSELPLPSNIFTLNTLAYDMMYGRETPFMKFAREHGAQVADGLGMLVEQAAEAFYLWRGVRPDTAPVIAALRLT
jgi:shikimate dehydrogenase